MKILFWNIRGVGKQDSRLTLEKLCKSHKPNFLFIAEPWISTSQIPTSCLQQLNLKIFAVNDRAQLISNLWCLCSHNYSPNIIASSLQFVALSIPIGDQLICVAAVYASTNYIARRDLWEDLAQLQQSYVNPWCFIGDFNAILGAHEYRGPGLPTRIPCEDFRAWTDLSHLIHIDTVGSFFTWSNGRMGSSHTEKKA